MDLDWSSPFGSPMALVLASNSRSRSRRSRADRSGFARRSDRAVAPGRQWPSG
jgi:hypothetical protein